MERIAKFQVAVSAAICLTALPLTACDAGPPRHVFVKASIEIKYEGSRYTFERWFTCSREYFSNWSGKHARFRDTNRLFTAKLDTGEGLLFITPRFCDQVHSTRGAWKVQTLRFKTDFGSYIPLFLIADNAENPAFLEAYVTDAVLKDPSSKLQLLAFSVRYSDRRNGQPSDPAQALPWLRGIRGRLKWHASYIFVFSKKAWEGSEELANYLEKIKSPQVLDGKGRRLADRIGLRRIPPSPDGVSGVAPGRPPCNPPRRTFRGKRERTAFRERCLRRTARTFSLRRIGKRPNRRMVIDRISPLRIRYYPSEAPLDCIKEGPGLKTYCLELRPDVVVAPLFANPTYDPQTGEILVIFGDSVSFWKFMKEAPRGRINSPSERSFRDLR